MKRLGNCGERVTASGWDTVGFSDLTSFLVRGARGYASDKQATRTAVEARERAIIRRLKSASGYTDAIGQLLKIVGSDDTTDMTTAKVDLTATVEANDVALAFTKLKSDGVNLYSKRDGDADYVFLAHDTISPYIDNRDLLVPGKPEVRRYKAIYVVGDDETGYFSDEVVVTVQP